MLHTRLIDELPEAEALVPAWRRLFDRAATPELVSTPTWVLSWWRVFSEDRTMRLWTASTADGELVGLAPLLGRRALYRGRLPLRRIELMGTGEDEADEVCSDYAGIVAARGEERRVADALAGALVSGELGRWDDLVLASMNASDAVAVEVERSLRARGARVERTPAGACPYVPLPSSWEAYLSRLDGSRRYTVTRSLRDLERWAGAGGYGLRRASTPGELREGRGVLHALHSERWADRGRAGVFVSDRFRRFHDRVMAAFLEGRDASLDLMWLTVRGEPIAAVYNIVYRNKVYFYQSGRRLDVPKGIRPGIALHALAIQRAIGEGRREYDLLAGESAYKTKLALASRPLMTMRAVAPTLRARALDAVRASAELAVVRLRQLRKTSAPAPPHLAEVVPLHPHGAADVSRPRGA